MPQAALDLNWIQLHIADVLVEGLKNQQIDEATASTLADFALERTQQAKSPQDITNLLQELVAKYQGFTNLQAMVHGVLGRPQEAQLAQQMLQLIKSGQASQAVSLAKQKVDQ